MLRWVICAHVDNCQYEKNTGDATFCSRCGAQLTYASAPVAPMHHSDGYQQQGYTQQPVATAVPVQQADFVIQPVWINLFLCAI